MAFTVEQFIARLTQSGLMSAAEVSTFQESLPPDKRPKDVQQLARALVQHGKLTKYQAQAVYEGKTKGLVFGEYVVLDKLGEGGMGVVLKARHRRMDRLVAIKVLSSAAMKHAGAVERFHREVQAAAKLEHPNIVTAYDATEHQGMHYLAMQYVDGKDLASIVRDHGPMGVREAVECILQAARGLQYAHSKGIVHRDIKPGNLLLDKDGTVKILDMGLALIAGAEAALGGPERLTATGQVMGTCDYMSPEQALDSHLADQRTDIYALGCTLYRLLTGHPPYQGETLMQILLAHQQAPIPSLCEARPEVPAELDTCFQRMVAKKPEDRYQSMAEVVAELEALLAALSGRSVAATVGDESSSAVVARTLAFLQEAKPPVTLTRQKKSTADQRARPYDPVRSALRAVPGQTAGAASSQGPERHGGRSLQAKLRNAFGPARRNPLLLLSIGVLLVALLAFVLTRTPSRTHDTAQPSDGSTAPRANSESQIPNLKSQIPAPPPTVAPVAASPPQQPPSPPKAPSPAPKPTAPKAGTAPSPAAGPVPASSPQQQPPSPPKSEAPLTPTAAKQKLPVPDAAAQAQARKAADSLFKTEIEKAKSAADKVALAKRLLAQALDQTGDTTGQYVLMLGAKDLAATARDAQTAFQVVDKLAEAFEVDRFAMKTDILAGWAKEARTLEARKWIVEQMLAVGDAAVDAGSLEAAKELGTLATGKSGGLHDKNVTLKLKAYRQRFIEAGKDLEELQEARAALAKDPKDPKASLVLGQYLCFSKGDWEKGLPLLAQGSDASLKGFARQELTSPPKQPDEQVKLGDAWWEIASARGRWQAGAIKIHAGQWYRQAEAALTASLVKYNVEKRLAEVRKLRSQLPSPLAAIAPFDGKKAKEHQQRWADYLGTPVEIANSIGMKLVLIPPGEFTMGSPKELIEEELKAHGDDQGYKERLPGEGPQHRVRITKPFTWERTW